MPEPENLVLQILREMRGEMATKADIARLEGNIADVRSEIGDVRSEVHSLRADVASDLLDLEKRLGDQIKLVRRSVMELHSTVVGHGTLYSELEERVARLEAHLNLSAPVRR